jgi:hypothetical protein
VWQSVNKEQVSWVLPSYKKKKPNVGKTKYQIERKITNLAIDIVISCKKRSVKSAERISNIDNLLLTNLHPATELHIASQSIENQLDMYKKIMNKKKKVFTSNSVDQTIGQVIIGLSSTSKTAESLGIFTI